MLKKFKNYDEIKDAKKGIRADFIENDDLALFYYGDKLAEDWGLSKTENIELSIFDMDDNLLLWQILKSSDNEVVNGNPPKLIMKPGDDLRSLNFFRGQYRICYSLYENTIGSFNGTKLFIEEMSSTRKEIRVIPVKTGVDNTDNEMSILFENLTADSISCENFKKLYFAKINSIEEKHFGFGTNKYISLISNNIVQLKNSTIGALNNILNKHLHQPLNLNDQKIIITTAINKAFIDVFNANPEGQEIWEQMVHLQWIYEDYKGILFSFIDFNNDYRILNYIANFGQGKTHLITNWIRDNKTFPSYPYSMIIKLYEPLPQDIKEKDHFWISKIITPPIIEKVFLLGSKDEELTGIYLRPANFDVEIADLTGRSTDLETWSSLISTDPTMSDQLINKFLSQSFDMGDIELNIDFTNYNNFINFGSATDRLNNFKYKLELIENYTDKIKNLKTPSSSSITGSSATQDNILLFDEKKKELKNNFDSYEKYLYYESGSYYSGSVKNESFINSIGEWPKKTSTKPYILYSTTESISIDWFNTQTAIAQRYDNENLNILTRPPHVPTYLTIDVNSEDYIIFLRMIGQYFDIFWTYIKNSINVSNRDQSIYKGMAKDITYYIAKSHGFDISSGTDNENLWRYAFGTDITGSYYDGSLLEMSMENSSKEIWRRILTNLPYILKTKGTSRSIKALLACYGIPTSILSIREYGGPDPRDYSNIQQKSAYIFDDFVYAINFEYGDNITSTWTNFTGSHKPHSIEFRVAFNENPTVTTQSLISTADCGVKFYTTSSKNNYGFFEFYNGTDVARTEPYRYLDNEFNSVIVRTYSSSLGWIHEIVTKKAESDRIIFESSASVVTSSAYENGVSLNIGSSFDGSMQEFRLYQDGLNNNTFNNHVRWNKGYNFNNPEETYNQLVLRYSFDEPKNHHTGELIQDVKPNQNYSNPGIPHNFDDEINYSPRIEEFAALTPQIGAGRFISNKIRIEESNLKSGQLSVNKKLEKAAFDTAPLDSNKLGIYFSPLEAINRDIIGMYAGIDLSNKIGDPEDRFCDRYDDLDELNKQYWIKYKNKNNFNAFIRVLKQFDKSFFDQLKSLLPARVNPVIGVLVEPHILDRSKISWRPIEEEQLDKKTILEGRVLPKFKTEYFCEETTMYPDNIKFLLDYITHETTVLYDFVSSDEAYINMIYPLQEIDNNYKYIMEEREREAAFKYEGFINTRETTIDKKDPVELFFTNPNKLKTVSTGPSKLKVE